MHSSPVLLVLLYYPSSDFYKAITQKSRTFLTETSTEKTFSQEEFFSKTQKNNTIMAAKQIK